MKFVTLSLLFCVLVSTAFSSPVVVSSTSEDNELISVRAAIDNERFSVFIGDNEVNEENLEEFSWIQLTKESERAKYLKQYIALVDKILKKLEEKNLQNTKFYQFLKKVRDFLQKALDKENENENEAFDINVSSDEESEILSDLEEQLEAQESEKAKYLRQYIALVDKIMKKMEEKNLQDTKVYQFLKKVRAYLQKALDKENENNKDAVAVSISDEESLEEFSWIQLTKESERAKYLRQYIALVDKIMKKLEEKNLQNTKFYQFLKKVRDFLQKALDKENENESFDINVSSDEESEILSDLEEQLEAEESDKAKYLKKYIAVVDKFLKAMEEKNLQDTKLYQFLKRLRAYLQKALDRENEKNKTLIADDDEEDDKSILEKLRERLQKLAERLRKRGKNARARIIEHYINVCERLLKKLEDNNLDKTKLHDFVKRVKKLLEKYAGDDKDEDQFIEISI